MANIIDESRLFVPEVGDAGAAALMELNREDLSVLVQAVTGHNFLNYHLNNTGRADSNKCRLCCEEKETTWHLFTECPALAMKRREIFYDHRVELPLSYGKIKQYLRHLDHMFKPEDTI